MCSVCWCWIRRRRRPWYSNWGVITRTCIGGARRRSTTPLREFSGDGFAADGAHFFLVDPLGNLMMHYSLDVPAKGMIRDLQKLLKISQVG